LPYSMPKRIKRVSPTQTDIFWNDGHISSYPSWYLRENCPCADCVDEFTGRRKILPGSIPATLERKSVELVGNYALHFEWSDDHSTGLYTFDLLRSLCPCSQCLPGGLKGPPEQVSNPDSFEV
jgi:DUF971 family protein